MLYLVLSLCPYFFFPLSLSQLSRRSHIFCDPSKHISCQFKSSYANDDCSLTFSVLSNLSKLLKKIPFHHSSFYSVTCFFGSLCFGTTNLIGLRTFSLRRFFTSGTLHHLLRLISISQLTGFGGLILGSIMLLFERKLSPVYSFKDFLCLALIRSIAPFRSILR